MIILTNIKPIITPLFTDHINTKTGIQVKVGFTNKTFNFCDSSIELNCMNLKRFQVMNIKILNISYYHVLHTNSTFSGINYLIYFFIVNNTSNFDLFIVLPENNIPYICLHNQQKQPYTRSFDNIFHRKPSSGV